MAVLFLLAVVLLAWQAPRTRPLQPPSYVSIPKSGEQVFPIAVPNWEAPEIPAAPGERRAFLEEQAVLWPGNLPSTGCDLFVRVSLHHWARRPVDLARLELNPEPAGWTALRWAGKDFLDDDDGDGDPLDAGELRVAGPGAEAEVFCPP
ncbi:MAG TPA: hypothetical protein VE685_25435 [Thermoanaerobaculia bacterium]|nr:hypothetical protein [Thermoanaerobaculia bacterium]